MPTIRNKFYPYRDVDEHDIVSFYSLDTSSGLAGSLVKIVTGSVNPSALDGWSNQSVGASIAGTASFRYETKAKVTFTQSGDTTYTALGLMLKNVLEFDENGQPLRYSPNRALEIGAVISGETVPIAQKGIFGIWGQYIDQSLGSAQPGNLVVVSRSGNGALAAVSPNGANFSLTGGPAVYGPQHIVGKFMTSLPTATVTGVGSDFSAQGGYAIFTFDANV